MSRQNDLEDNIRESYAILREYEAILRTSDRPEEKARARRVIQEQRSLSEGYLAEYRGLTGGALPDEIAQAVDHIASIDLHLFPERRIPLQRPARAPHFVGREKELARLLEELRPGRVVTLCGPGGIGKSALAAEAIWTLAPGDDPPECFPDGVITYNFDSQGQAALALEHMALSYGEELSPTPKDAARRALAGRRALLLLDSTEAADDLSTVLEVRGRCGVLVTSRRTQDAVADWQEVAPLTTEEAIALLQAWAGEWAADGSVAGQICELVGGLPLAVRLVGRYLAQHKRGAAGYRAWLHESPL